LSAVTGSDLSTGTYVPGTAFVVQAVSYLAALAPLAKAAAAAGDGEPVCQRCEVTGASPPPQAVTTRVQPALPAHRASPPPHASSSPSSGPTPSAPGAGKAKTKGHSKGHVNPGKTNLNGNAR